MAVAKWNWHSTNISRAFGRGYAFAPAWSELVLTNATKAETERAYQTLINRGPVSDFSVKVWNDICAKIYDLCDEWKINEYYRKYVNFTPFIHTPDRDLWRAFARITWPQWSEYEVEEWCDYIWGYWWPGALGATMYNTVYSKWLLPVGLTKPEVKRGDRLLSEHIFTLTEFINHWCDLSPIEFGLYLALKNNDRVNTNLLESVHVIPELLELQMLVSNHTKLGEALPFSVLLEMFDLARKANAVELLSMALASRMNFMTLNVSCKVWDKNIVYAIPEMLRMGFNTSSLSHLVPGRQFCFSDSFKWHSVGKGKLSNAYAVEDILLQAFFNAIIHPQFGYAYGFHFSDSFSDDGFGTLRYRRGMPFSALTRYEWSGRAFVEHEGIVTMEMDTGLLQIQDRIRHDTDDAKDTEHDGQIPFREYATDLKVFDSKSMSVVPEDIIYHADSYPFIVGDAKPVEQAGRFRTGKDITFATLDPELLGHSGDLHSASGYIEPTFANEQILETRQGSFGVEDGEIEISFRDIEPLMQEGLVDTNETIDLSESPTYEIEANESKVYTSQSGELNYDAIIEQAAEAVISTIVTGELGTSLNAFPEIDVIAATIRHAAEMGTTRLAKIEVEASVSSVESAIMKRVARKLIESNVEIRTTDQAIMIARLIHFLESANVVGTQYEAEAIDRLPRILRPTNANIRANAAAFMDASYVKGDSLIADVAILYGIEAAAELVRNRAVLEALGMVYAIPDANMDQSPTTEMLGGAIAEADSDAHIVMAHSILKLAADMEDELVSDLESILAFDVERTLVFD